MEDKMTRKSLGEIELSEVLRKGDPVLLAFDAKGIVTLVDFLEFA